jgi:hypothetical protein
MSYASSVFGDAHQGLGDQSGQTSVTDERGVRDAVADVIVGVTEHPGAAMKTPAGGAAKTLLGPGEWAMRRLFLDDRSARDASRPASWYEIGRPPSGLEFRAHAAAITAAMAIYGIALAGAGHALRFRLPILPFALLCGACYRRRETTTGEAACQTMDANSCR